MEVKKSGSITKKEDDSFKGISLVFSKSIQQGPRLTSSATTWAAEEIKMKCIFNKGIAFCSNDTIRHNISAEINIQDPISPSKAIVQQTSDSPSYSSNILEEDYLVTETVSKSKTQFAADIYSLVKSSSNMLILEEMKANEIFYNRHLGSIYTQAADDTNSADESMNNVIETPKPDIYKPEIVPPKEKQGDTNRSKERTNTLLNTGEVVIEMEDVKNGLKTTDLGPGVLTVACLDESTNETIEDDASADRISVIEPERNTFTAEIKDSIKDSTPSKTAVCSTDKFPFANSTNSKTRNPVVTAGTTSHCEDYAKISSLPLSRKLPKALSVIQETGYSDANFSDSLLQPQSDSKLDLKKSDGEKLISSDSSINKTFYKIKFEPEASTSAYKQILKSLIYSSEDDTLITLEKNEIAHKDKQSNDINKLKIGEPIEQKKDDNLQCEPF